MEQAAREFVRLVIWLAKSGGYIASAALLVMTVGVTLDVLARYILGAGTKFAIELSGYLLVMITFLGLAYTHATDGHIRIDFLVKRLSPQARRWHDVFDSLLFLAYTLILAYFGWVTFWTSYQFQTTSRTGMDVLVWPYQLVIPVGLVLTSLLLLANILHRLVVRVGVAISIPPQGGANDGPELGDGRGVPVFVMIFGSSPTGVPVAVALGSVGIISTYLFLQGKGMGIIGYAAWEMSNSFILGAVPLFIFMGQLLLHSGISQRLYRGQHRFDRQGQGRAPAGEHFRLCAVRDDLRVERRDCRDRRPDGDSRDGAARLRAKDHARFARRRRHARHPHPAEHRLHHLRGTGRAVGRQLLHRRRSSPEFCWPRCSAPTSR